MPMFAGPGCSAHHHTPQYPAPQRGLLWGPHPSPAGEGELYQQSNTFMTLCGHIQGHKPCTGREINIADVDSSLKADFSWIWPRATQLLLLKTDQVLCALRVQGITSIENRKEWPLSVLRKVLEQLMADTPADLLARSVTLWHGKPLSWGLELINYFAQMFVSFTSIHETHLETLNCCVLQTSLT